MIAELAELVSEFPGQANRTRCFAHILNLVAKSVIKQFDVPKAGADAALDEAAQALHELAGGIDDEEEAREGEEVPGVDDDELDDDEDGLVDEREEMSEVEREKFDETVQPVRLMLVKVKV